MAAIALPLTIRAAHRSCRSTLSVPSTAFVGVRCWAAQNQAHQPAALHLLMTRPALSENGLRQCLRLACGGTLGLFVCKLMGWDNGSFFCVYPMLLLGFHFYTQHFGQLGAERLFLFVAGKKLVRWQCLPQRTWVAKC